MEALQDVIKLVLSQCAKEGVKPAVSETLAAFVLRMVVYDSPDRFSMDVELDEDTVAELVDRVVSFLSQTDSPALETVRMQADFDLAYFGNQSRMADAKAAQAEKLTSLQSSIAAATADDAADFDRRTALYRQIFSYLMVHTNAQSPPDAEVQREVAAALESVFPRVGLKSFVALSKDEKYSQLSELSHLILGIRVFNWDLGKGGAGIVNLPELTSSDAADLADKLETQFSSVSEICQQYTDVLALPASALEETEGDQAALRARWKTELANRRQLSSFLSTLSDDLQGDLEALKSTIAAFQAELDDLKRIVGARSTVPKEQVYPKFHSMAAAWLAVQDLRERILARKAVHNVLQAYVPPTLCTLHLDTVRKARQAILMNRVPGAASATGTSASSEAKSDAGSVAPSADGGDASKEEDDPDAPVRLTVESSPDFMQLPLEYQGYCCVALVNQAGLLLPGDPAHGVVKYGGRYMVFASEDNLKAFMAEPAKFAGGVLDAAKHSPELVHLLQLQAFFPEASLSAIIRGDAPQAVASEPSGPPAMRDAATETPIHFVEKHIDPRYHWNEWDMRRQALRVANLKNARTVSTQAHMSYFRRDNDTQVYLAKAAETQTGVDRGTNPPRVVRYVAGLRGTGTLPKEPGTETDSKGSEGGAGARAGGGGGAGSGGGGASGGRTVSVATYTFEV